MNINLLFAGKEKNITGVNRLICECLSEILTIDKKNNYYTSEDNWLGFKINNSCNTVVTEIVPLEIRTAFFMKLNGISLVHSFYNPFDKVKFEDEKKIITVHDVTPLVNDKWFNGDKAWKDFFDVRLRKSCEIADMICSVSQNTKKDIVEYFNIPEEKIRVVYPGCYLPYKGRLDKEFSENDVMKKYGLVNREFILSVCTIEPRKNLKGLIEAFKIFKEHNRESPIKLVLCGRLGWDNTFSAFYEGFPEKFKADVVLTGYVSDADLDVLYENALAFAYVSFYEGFGSPILEALQRKKAVICSNISSMPEVGGDAVLYCNPYNVESIFEDMERLANDSELVASLEKKAFLQASKFSYKKMAREMVDIYNMFG